MGGYLLDVWGLDERIAQAAVEHHIRPVYGLSACVAKADWIAHHLGFGTASVYARPPETPEHPRQHLLALAPRVAKAFETEREFFN